MVDWNPTDRVALAQHLSSLCDTRLTDDRSTDDRRHAALKTLLAGLKTDDNISYSYRRQLLHAGLATKHLVPILWKKKNTSCELRDLVLVLLENLTTPEENLFPPVVTVTSSQAQEARIQLPMGVRRLREELSQRENVCAIVTTLHTILYKEKYGKLEPPDLDTVSTILRLVRNLLSGPIELDARELNRFRNLLWSMFSANFGQALSDILSSPYLGTCCVAVAEVLAQLYRLYPSTYLRDTLQNWMDFTLSDSSEDDESNTSPPERVDGRQPYIQPNIQRTGQSCSSADSSPQPVGPVPPGDTEMPPGDLPPPPPPRPPPPPDRRDNTNTNSPAKKRGRDTVLAEKRLLASGGLNESTSSDEGPEVKRMVRSLHHHKPHHTVKHRSPKLKTAQSQELKQQQPKPDRKLQLLRYTRSRARKIMALVSRDPSQEDIDAVMIEFTIQFLMDGYSQLAAALMSTLDETVDKSHLYWLIVYFLKLSLELKIDFANVRWLLSPELLSLLTYEAVRLVGPASLHPSSSVEALHSQRQLHMLVNSVREILASLEGWRDCGSEEEKLVIQQTEQQMGCLRQFRQLLVMLIGQCSADLSGLAYLRDLVLTNHLFISTQERVNQAFPLVSHVELFAEPSLIARYSVLLKHFSTNPPVLNDALFTMLHHVAGHVGRLDLLFQPCVLKTFSDILASELPLLQDWLDLIEYTIHRFMERQQENTARAAMQADSRLEAAATLGSPVACPEESVVQSMRALLGTCSDERELLRSLSRQLAAEMDHTPSSQWVLDKLLSLRLIPFSTYLKLKNDGDESGKESAYCSSEDGETASQGRGSASSGYASLQIEGASQILDPAVHVLIGCVLRDQGSGGLRWLQTELLEICYVRIRFSSVGSEGSATLSATQPLPEPVPYFCQLRGHDTPLVPQTKQQIRAVNSPLFQRLLKALGLEVPTASCVYPVVPAALALRHLYLAARKLGPIPTGGLKFDLDHLEALCLAPSVTADLGAQKQQMTEVTDSAITQLPEEQLRPPTAALPPSAVNWMSLVSRQKAANLSTVLGSQPRADGSAAEGDTCESMDEADIFSMVTSDPST